MLQMFKEFYKLDYNGQTTHLAELCLKVVEVNRHTVNECTSKRQCTIPVSYTHLDVYKRQPQYSPLEFLETSGFY